MPRIVEIPRLGKQGTSRLQRRPIAPNANHFTQVRTSQDECTFEICVLRFDYATTIVLQNPNHPGAVCSVVALLNGANLRA